MPISASRFLFRQAGFTFLEFIIVVALMATVYVVAVPNLNLTRTADLERKVGQVAVDFKSAYDMAVLTGKPHRLVFHVISGDYWLEETEVRDFTFSTDGEGRDLSPREQKENLEAFEADFEEYVELAGEEIEDSENERVFTPESPVVQAKKRLQPAQWSRVSTSEWKKRSLGPELLLMDIEAEHHTHPIKLDPTNEEQVAMIYFFPAGYVERAVLHVGLDGGDYQIDDSQPPYTMTTSPYQGVLNIESGYEEVDVHDDRQK